MKYQPPFKPGATPAEPGIHNDDADAPYVNGNAETGVEGSVPPAEGWEHPQREILKVITEAGLTPDHEDLTQLWQALQLLYGQATTNYLNLPVYPEGLTADGKLAVNNNGGGVLELAPAQEFVWRGWVKIDTDDVATAHKQVTTVANKTYHARWSPPGYGAATPAATYPHGLVVLEDLADAGYNPTSAAEDDAAFDTTYDDMLIAVVTTDGSNVPTIKSVVNKQRLESTTVLTDSSLTNDGANSANTTWTVTQDWARTPQAIAAPYTWEYDASAGNDADMDCKAQAITRYSVDVYMKRDFATDLGATLRAVA